MSWQGIVGHDPLVERFRRSLSQGRLATTFLFVGPEGIGKRSFALKLAQAMLCSAVSEQELAPCGTCPECQQVHLDTHPDLELVRKPADRAFIPVETFIGDRGHRMRSGLCHFISLTPSDGKRRIAIIDDADWLNQEGANSLLKTLEEPSPGAVIILVSTSAQRQLPTIRSRSQIIRFQPLSEADVAQCLIDQGFDQPQASAMATRSDGSVSRAIALSDEATIEFRRQLWQELAKTTIDRSGLAKIVNAFIDSGGKDTSGKREQVRVALHASIEFYRAVARRQSNVEVSRDLDLQEYANIVLERASLSADILASLVERCVDTIKQTNSNANLGILVDAWICDLAVTTRTGKPLLNALD